jgi:hypothetical protein
VAGPQLAIELLRQRPAIELLSGPGALERSKLTAAPVVVGTVVVGVKREKQLVLGMRRATSITNKINTRFAE